MRPRGLSSSSPSRLYVGQVARQKPQCTHLRRMASASAPSGVSLIQSASRVCISGMARGPSPARRGAAWSEVVHAAGVEDARGIEGGLEPLVDLEDGGL